MNRRRRRGECLFGETTWNLYSYYVFEKQNSYEGDSKWPINHLNNITNVFFLIQNYNLSPWIYSESVGGYTWPCRGCLNREVVPEGGGIGPRCLLSGKRPGPSTCLHFERKHAEAGSEPRSRAVLDSDDSIKVFHPCQGIALNEVVGLELAGGLSTTPSTSSPSDLSFYNEEIWKKSH